jgi:hypothetical protein
MLQDFVVQLINLSYIKKNSILSNLENYARFIP